MRTIPPRGDDARSFWMALAGGELVTGLCRACGRRWVPPFDTCPRCASRDVTVAPAAPFGRLYSWSIIHMAVDESLLDDTPYTVGLVTLDDGCRLYGRIIDIPRDELRDGLPLRVTVDRSGDHPIWCFTSATRQMTND